MDPVYAVLLYTVVVIILLRSFPQNGPTAQQPQAGPINPVYGPDDQSDGEDLDPATGNSSRANSRALPNRNLTQRVE